MPKFDFDPSSMPIQTLIEGILLSSKREDINLNLDGLKLGILSSENLEKALSIIPKCIMRLYLSNNSLAELADNGLAKSLSAIPKNVRVLCLRGNKLGFLTLQRLITVLKAIPSNIKDLDLSENGIGYGYDSIHLAGVFAAIPPNIKALSIKGNPLSHLGLEGLSPAFTAIPMTVKRLSMGNLNSLSAEEVAQLLSVMPSGISELDISQWLRSDRTVDELITIVSAIPESVTTIDFGFERFRRKDDDIVKVLQAFPKTVTTFKMQGSIDGEQDLARIFGAIPDSVTSLNIGYSRFANYSIKNLKKGFSALPKRLSSLNIEACSLGNIKGLPSIIAQLPKSLTRVNLRSNSFWRQGDGDFIQLCREFPRGITTLDFAHNDLHLKSGETLEESFSELPKALTHFIVRGNHFLSVKCNDSAPRALPALPCGLKSIDFAGEQQFKYRDSFAELLATLPSSVTNVAFRYDVFQKMNESQIKAIRTRFPSIDQITLLDNGDLPVDLTESVDVANHFRALGFKTMVPSLLSQCSLFIRNNPSCASGEPGVISIPNEQLLCHF